MTTTVQSNGQARKTLSAQIDRLDAMLDGLAEGIQETVVSAVQQAVGQAVREAVQVAVSQVLTNPELQRHLLPEPAASTAAPEPVSPPVPRVGGWLTRLGSRVGHAMKTVVQVAAKTLCGAARWGVTGVLGAGRHGYRFVKTLLLAGWLRLKSVCRKIKVLCSPLVLSVWVGLVVGVFTFAAGPFLASLLSGLIGQLLVLKALVVQPLRQWIEVNPDGGAE